LILIQVNEEQDLWKSWQVETTLFSCGRNACGEKGSILWMPALQFWLQSELSSKLGSKKARDFLATNNTRDSSVLGSNLACLCSQHGLLPSFQTKLKQDATLTDMARFILTCVASVQGQIQTQLRFTAWSTTATLCSRGGG
jgi:hypothetical protein